MSILDNTSYIALTCAVYSVFALRFVSYTHLFGYFKDLQSELLIMLASSLTTAIIFFYNRLCEKNRILKSISTFIIACTILDFTYNIFIITDNFPIYYLIIKTVSLFILTSTIGFIVIYLINRYIFRISRQK